MKGQLFFAFSTLYLDFTAFGNMLLINMLWNKRCTEYNYFSPWVILMA